MSWPIGTLAYRPEGGKFRGSARQEWPCLRFWLVCDWGMMVPSGFLVFLGDLCKEREVQADCLALQAQTVGGGAEDDPSSPVEEESWWAGNGSRQGAEEARGMTVTLRVNLRCSTVS